jgi:hypothetical protein
METAFIAALTGLICGVIFGSIGYALGRILRERWWPKAPPPLPHIRMGPLTITCPHCQEAVTIEIDMQDADLPPPPGIPLGERLRQEKSALMARLAAVASNSPEAARYRERMAAIDRELGRFH